MHTKPLRVISQNRETEGGRKTEKETRTHEFVGESDKMHTHRLCELSRKIEGQGKKGRQKKEHGLASSWVSRVWPLLGEVDLELRVFLSVTYDSTPCVRFFRETA